MTLRTLLTYLLSLVTASAQQRLLVPAYEPEIGHAAIFKATKQGIPTTIIFNPADGPGHRLLPKYLDLYKAAKAAGVPMLGYIDLIDWTTKPQRVKTADELTAELRRYQAFYPKLEGWFLDDLLGNMVGKKPLLEVATWRGEIVGNPGCPISKWPKNVDTLIIHEGDGFLEHHLPEAYKKHRHKLGIMALNEPAWQPVAAAAAGYKYIYAHQLSDEWKLGRSAYNTLPKYWVEMGKEVASEQ
jgi:hypothetical protein